MTRRDHLACLIDELSGPLGPMTSPAERAAEITLFLATVGPGDVEALTEVLFEVARNRDPGDLWADQRELLAQEALTSASGEAPLNTLAVMTDALRDLATRGTALDMIGALGLAAGVKSIVAVLGQQPSEDDLIRAAAALGEIGGEAARAALATVAELMPGSRPVQEEVLAALAQLDRRGCD